MNATLTAFAYLFAAVLFIIGLKMLSSPRTARRGNVTGALGMLIAIVVTLTDKKIIDFTLIIAGLLVGSAIGLILARKVQMTGMPQMVGVLNGFGGGASTLVAYAEYMRLGELHTAASLDVLITIPLSLLIGTVTFVGSMVAAAKLQGIMTGAPILYPFQKQTNAAMLAAIVTLTVLFVMNPAQWYLLIFIIVLSTVLGVTSVIPIGGADMPVVISLMNSYSGLAGATTGFILSNSVLIISGTLVGTSGIILTQIMCKAMNRSLGNVLFAGVGTDYSGPAARAEQRTVVRYTPDDAAMMIDNAQSIIIVPGYGLAVAQAQHVLQEMVSTLTAHGKDGALCHSPRGGTDARAYECPAGRSKCPVRHPHGDGPGQRRFSKHRHRHGDRGERRGQSRRADQEREPVIRHADSERGPFADGHGIQTEPEPRLCRRRQ